MHWLHIAGITSLMSFIEFNVLSNTGNNKTKNESLLSLDSSTSKHIYDKEKIEGEKTSDGMTIETAIILPSHLNLFDGISEIYKILSKMYGQRHKDWDLIVQTTIESKGRRYDEMKVKLKNGKVLCVYFDKSDIGSDFKELLKNI